jgi:hypothetical protein
MILDTFCIRILFKDTRGFIQMKKRIAFFLFLGFYLSINYSLQARCGYAGTGKSSFPKDVKVIASSTLKDKNKTYSPEKVLDYKYNTAWCEGKEGDGIGEWIEFQFSPNSFFCGELILMPGITASQSLYEQNNRIKEFEILVKYKDGHSFSDIFTIPDKLCTNLDRYCKLTNDALIEHYGFEELSYGKCLVKYTGSCVPPILVTPHGPEYPGFGYNNEKLSIDGIISVRFIIKSVYKGSKYNDTCITEVFPSGILE